jgi:hypothetical protein
VALPPENLLFLMRGKVSPAGKRVTGTFPIAAGCVKTESPSTQQSGGAACQHSSENVAAAKVYFSGARASPSTVFIILFKPKSQ